jgi:hypothetical protein
MVVLNASNTWDVVSRFVSSVYKNLPARQKFMNEVDVLVNHFDSKDPVVEHLVRIRQQLTAVGCAYSTHDMTHAIYTSTLRLIELTVADPQKYKSMFDTYCKLF